MLRKLIFSAFCGLFLFAQNGLAKSTDRFYDTDAVIMLHADGADSSSNIIDDGSAQLQWETNTIDIENGDIPLGHNAELDTLKNTIITPAPLTEYRILLHCDGEDDGVIFTDSAGAVTWQAEGDSNTTQTDVKKFGTAACYRNEAGVGESINTTVSETNDYFDVGTGDFTVDFWIYFVDKDQKGKIFTPSGGGGDSFVIDWYGDRNPDRLQIKVENVVIFNHNSDVVNNTWYHYALTRASGVLYLFVNGIKVNEAVNTAFIDMSGDNPGKVGETPYAYIDEFRYLVGEAAWTSDFTPPIEAYTYEADEPTITTIFGGSSLSFNLYGNRSEWIYAILDAATSQTLSLESDPFTIDFRFRFQTHTTNDELIRLVLSETNQFSWKLNYYPNDDNFKFDAWDDNNNQIEFLIPTGELSDEVWYHFALIRDTSGILTAYLDGVEVANTEIGIETVIRNLYNPLEGQLQFQLGASPNIKTTPPSVIYEYQGWIDEFRLVKNTTIWKTNFTPPTLNYDPFPAFQAPEAGKRPTTRPGKSGVVSAHNPPQELRVDARHVIMVNDGPDEVYLITNSSTVSASGYAYINSGEAFIADSSENGEIYNITYICAPGETASVRYWTWD